MVSFLSPPEYDAEHFEKSDFKVIMSRSQTPKKYLGALNQLVRRNLKPDSQINQCFWKKLLHNNNNNK